MTPDNSQNAPASVTNGSLPPVLLAPGTGNRLADTLKSKFEQDIILGDITKHNTNMMRLINERAFPITYQDKFYEDASTRGEYAKLAFFQDVPVGAVCCRTEQATGINGATIEEGNKLYIMTLGCLPAFRRSGVGTAMLKHVFHLVDNDPSITSIYLHVQVNNQDAIKFYERHGFSKVSTAENYYKKVEPTDAYLVERRVRDKSMPPVAISSHTTTPSTAALGKKGQKNSK